MSTHQKIRSDHISAVILAGGQGSRMGGVPKCLLTVDGTTLLERHLTAMADAGIAAALREAHEEVGLHPRYVEVIGQLPVYVTGSGFHVTPVVALLEPPLVLQQIGRAHV